MAVDPITIGKTISSTIGLIEKLFAAFPNYKERIAKIKYMTYKKLPRHKRVSRYMMNLKMEFENHLFESSEFIK